MKKPLRGGLTPTDLPAGWGELVLLPSAPAVLYVFKTEDEAREFAKTSAPGIDAKKQPVDIGQALKDWQKGQKKKHKGPE
jgi:hypothetical protein